MSYKQVLNRIKAYKKNIMTFSVVLMLISVVGLAMATFALFSDSVSTHNRIQAGSLEVGFFQTARYGVRLDEDGMFTQAPALEQPLDLKTLGLDQSIFSLDNICPGVYEEAVFEVRNYASTTAFHYGIILRDFSLIGSESARDQIAISVSDAEGVRIRFTLAEAGTSKEVDLGIMKRGDSVATFEVRVEFLDTDQNNEANSASVTFDLTLRAVQVTPDEI